MPSPLLRLQYKWALWQVDDSGTAVTIAAVGDKAGTWDDFLAALPDSDCRYGGMQGLLLRGCCGGVGCLFGCLWRGPPGVLIF
jgi:hypothetical protein